MHCPGLIEKGSTDTVSVRAIKLRLNELIGSTLDTDNGNFGDSTEAVVKQFQKKYQLISDGKVGELTWERLFTTSIVQQPQSNILRLRALEIMQSQLFVREATNNNDGPQVEAYLKAVGLPKGFSWCMAAVYWSFNEAANDLGVLNPVPKTAGVLDCLAKAQQYIVVGDPEPGDQFIMDFGAGKGHTGMVEIIKPEHRIYTCEGNTSADPTYAGEDRDGNGMFERNRAISGCKAFLRYE